MLLGLLFKKVSLEFRPFQVFDLKFFGIIIALLNYFPHCYTRTLESKLLGYESLIIPTVSRMLGSYFICGQTNF